LSLPNSFKPNSSKALAEGGEKASMSASSNGPCKRRPIDGLASIPLKPVSHSRAEVSVTNLAVTLTPVARMLQNSAVKPQTAFAANAAYRVRPDNCGLKPALLGMKRDRNQERPERLCH
jgi:hypothetical protein